MKYLQKYESWFSRFLPDSMLTDDELIQRDKKNSNRFIKSDYTFEENAPSKIDPSKEIKIRSWMKCPVCGVEMEDIEHGEIRECDNCKTKMQVFGNLLTINDVKDVGINKKTPKIKDPTKTKEKLRLDDYERGNQMICPLCKTTINKIEHGETKKCHQCGLKMKVLGNSLYCKIDNDQLELYTNANKYNL